MTQMRIPAVFMRGGTSKAIMLKSGDLPAERAEWDPLFLAIMGSPDPNARQLDGMGGGISSLSKVCVIGPPSRADADLDYTFAQVGVTEAVVDYAGNCGNMSSAVGPFAVDEGLVSDPADGEAAVRIHNTNTGKLIVSRFAARDGRAVVTGDQVLDGVAGSGAPVRLEFLEPGGSKTGKLLPAARAVDTLEVPALGAIEASLVDAANPCVFVPAEALGLSGLELPGEIERDAALLETLEAIRRAASVAMGIAPTLETAARVAAVPKVAMVSAPAAAPTLSGRALTAEEMDIAVRMISVGQPHRAVPLTGAACLAIAASIPGSIPHRLANAGRGNAPVRIAHPSGIAAVEAKVSTLGGETIAEQVAVYRTARRLFEGYVLVPPPSAAMSP